MVIRVGINGYGTIGKRVADAVKSMPDMELMGIVKVNPDYGYYVALEKNIPVYTIRDRLEVFRERGLRVEGVLEDLLEDVDIVVDATPAGYGEYYYKKYYSGFVEKNKLKAIFQGGEKTGVAEHSFNAYCNPEEIIGSRTVRVVSCNTTGLLRIICVLDKLYGVKKVRATIIRRGADPKEDKRGPINSIRLNPPKIPSHHALDVKTVVPRIDIETAAVVVPTTLMHVHSVYMVLEREANRDELIDYLRNYRRIILLSSEKTGVDSTAKIIEASRDLGRIRYDIPELIVWEDTIHVKNNELWLLQAVHQESIVVPENIDAIRGLMNTEGYPVKSIELTDKILNIGFFLKV
jgi:glyceraldehyde-3-phosphate dehydrogenase (NAD(P))